MFEIKPAEHSAVSPHPHLKKFEIIFSGACAASAPQPFDHVAKCEM